MDEILDADEARSRAFEIVRRGYDKRQVERFRDEAAVAIAALVTELEDLKQKFAQAGMVDVPDLKSELDAVSAQVAEILESARSAAEGMRSRASEDAARWRAEADRESRELRRSSARDAEQARRSAWEDGTELLKQADVETARMLEEASQEALFIRAEAEREALRLTGDARRDREEAMRRARSESERVLIEARAESERILEKARRSAHSAQERAQALEQRRAELMQELESARLSIGQLEQEIDTRREALHAVAEAPDSGVRVVRSSGEAGQEWMDEDASVRIVPASRVAPDEPVDPDAFVAEVEQLQSEIAGAAAAIEEVIVEASAPPPVVAPVAPEQPEVVDEEEEEEPPPEEEPSEPVEAAIAGEVAESPRPADTAQPAEGGDERPGPPDGIDDLFAQLRTGSRAPEPSAEAEAPVQQSKAKPKAGAVATLEEPAPEASARPIAAAREVMTDPFELRDRVLLPIENRTLRSLKRRVVDLQNRVLDELRVGEADWVPQRPMFVEALSDDLARMNRESFVAGHAAAAELVGESATPPPDRGAEQRTSGEFVDAFVTAVADALKRTRASGGGSRQVSAAVGRVFRAWRTDEAERRLRRAGYLAYNEGLVGAYPGLGVDAVVAVAPGTPCGSCPAGTGTSWEPAGPLPAGTAFPPATGGCRATILPAA